jgi:hypothetical protein
MTLIEVCKDNLEAVDFLNRWSKYVHAVDDLVDEPFDSGNIIKSHATAIEIYTHPFFLKNLVALRQVAIYSNNLYADSVVWEKSDEKWKLDFVDWARHSPSEMVIATANIVGGYDHMRVVSLEMRKLCYFEHHREDGKAI